MIVNGLKRYFKRSLPGVKFLGWGHWMIGLSSRLFSQIRMYRCARWCERYHSAKIVEYLDRHYVHIIDSISIPLETQSSEVTQKRIWTLWWQGINDAPESVLRTIGSMRSNAGDFDVIVIDKYNYQEYIDFPFYIMEKFSKGIISIQNFSDILRLSLIAKYGGIWMDANLLVLRPIKIDWNSDEFITSKKAGEYLWTGFFMGGRKNNVLATMASKIFFAYWKDNDALIDYLLIDRIIELCYNKSAIVKRMIDSVNSPNKDIMWVLQNLNKNFSEAVYKDIIANNVCLKLTHKLPLLDAPDTYAYRLLTEFS